MRKTAKLIVKLAKFGANIERGQTKYFSTFTKLSTI